MTEAPADLLAVKVRQAADMVGVSPSTIRAAVKSGLIDVRYPYKGGRDYVIPVESLKAWLNRLPDEPPDG